MITARCPSCSYEYQIPSTFIGKKIKCKQEGCGQVFKVAKEDIEPVEVILEPGFDELQPAEETYQVESGYLHEDSLEFSELMNDIQRDNQFESTTKRTTTIVSSSQARLIFYVLCLIACSQLLSTAISVSLIQKRWEYTIETPSDTLFDSTMAELGDNGWELVFARRSNNSSDSASYEMIFRRPKRPAVLD